MRELLGLIAGAVIAVAAAWILMILTFILPWGYPLAYAGGGVVGGVVANLIAARPWPAAAVGAGLSLYALLQPAESMIPDGQNVVAALAPLAVGIAIALITRRNQAPDARPGP